MSSPYTGGDEQLTQEARSATLDSRLPVKELMMVDESTATSATETVRAAVASWEGVATHEHRFGGVEFRLGRRELGHLHPRFADLPFPRRIRDELVATEQAKPHHVLPDSGWVTVPMRTASEVAHVIDLFRQNYERLPAVAVVDGI